MNIRRHVDQVKEPVPKKQGGGGWLSGPLAEAGVAQLRAHVEAMVLAAPVKRGPLEGEAVAGANETRATRFDRLRVDVGRLSIDLVAAAPTVTAVSRSVRALSIKAEAAGASSRPLVEWRGIIRSE